jgi:hypothetical protein
MMMIRDIENALRTDGDRLYFIMSPQIVKEVRLRSPLKFAFELLCLDPNFCHSDRDLCGMKVGDLPFLIARRNIYPSPKQAGKQRRLERQAATQTVLFASRTPSTIVNKNGRIDCLDGTRGQPCDPVMKFITRNNWANSDHFGRHAGFRLFWGTVTVDQPVC